MELFDFMRHDETKQAEHQAATAARQAIQQFFFCRPAARRQKEELAEMVMAASSIQT